MMSNTNQVPAVVPVFQVQTPAVRHYSLNPLVHHFRHLRAAIVGVAAAAAAAVVVVVVAALLLQAAVRLQMSVAEPNLPVCWVLLYPSSALEEMVHAAALALKKKKIKINAF